MLLKIYSIYDVKAGAYLQPMFFKSTPEALRAFGDACNDPESVFFKHAEDYSLYELGQYNDSSGQFIPMKEPYSLMSAKEASRKHVDYYAAFALEQSGNKA